MFGRGFAFLQGSAESRVTGSGAVEPAGASVPKERVPNDETIVFFDTQKSPVPTKEEIRGEVIEWPMHKDSRMAEKIEGLRAEHHSDALAKGAAETATVDMPVGAVEAEASDRMALEAVESQPKSAAESDKADIEIVAGQRWANADGESFEIKSVDDSEGAQEPIVVSYLQGESVPKGRAFSVQAFSEYLEEGGFEKVAGSAAESDVQAELWEKMERHMADREAVSANPLMRPTQELLDAAHIAAEGKGDDTMLEYLRGVRESLGVLAKQSKFTAAEFGRLGEMHQKLEEYAKSSGGKKEEVPDKEAAEQEPVEVFKSKIEALRQEVLEKIRAAESIADLENIGRVEDRSVGGKGLALRMFFGGDADGLLKQALESAGKASVSEAKKLLNDANRLLRKAWYEEKRRLETKPEQRRKKSPFEKESEERAPKRRIFDAAFSAMSEDMKMKIAEAGDMEALMSIRKGGKSEAYRFFDLNEGAISGYLNAIKDKKREEVFGKIREAEKELETLFEARMEQLKRSSRKPEGKEEAISAEIGTASQAKKKNPRARRGAPKPIDKDDAAHDFLNNRQNPNPFDKDDAALEFADNRGGRHTLKPRRERPIAEEASQERAYEALESAAEQDGAYYTLFGAIATGLRTMKEAVPGIVEKKDEYADRIVEAIMMTSEASFDAVASRFGWSEEEKKIFAEGVVRKGIEKFLR